ncbi:MAG TPA: amino acid adenylation domain-containing protein, partial [Calditrichia bacterium]|nr:amino acid adenylation domain-containing protein [Calditrichia bacterium]
TLTYRGELIKRSLSPALSERLRAFARSEQVTLFMVLLSAFKVLLLRYTRQEDILVGTPIANRERKEIQDLIGYFQNTVTLRSDLSGNPTFRELLKRISTTAREAFANQSLPFERVVELVQPLRDKSLTPLFQCAFTFNSYTAAETWQNTLQLPGIVATTEMYHNRTAKFDLSLGMVDEGERIGAALEYATDLFEAATMEDLLSHFETLLESILASPDRPIGDLDLLNPAEEQAVLENWRRRDPEVPEDQTLHGLVTAQGVRTPDRIALRFGERELSYRELERQADHLARRLIARGAAPGRIVGVFLERSEKLPLALLGILKSGAAYLPLDPGHPPTRLQMILADAGATLLVSEQACREQLPDTLPDMMFIDDGEDSPDSSAVTLPDLSAGELAYLIYTSGSTGQPKGVEIPHRAIVNFLWSMREEPGIVPEDNLLAVTTPAFDISLLEIFLPLIAGATVEICPAHLTGDGAGLLRHIREKGITMMQATPATWRLMLESGWNDPLPIKVLCGGEALPDDLRQALLARGVELWNMYGPTETTVWSTLARIEDSEAPITIGKPIANTDIYVLDSRNRPCPPGVPGELCIGGRGLARGYRNRPELTAQKFFEFMPTSGGPARRIYRTGDLACLLANGQIAYLGRLDFQLKIRGFRIEAGEVEKALMTVEGIEQAVVVGKNFGSGDTRLVAYLTAGARSEPALLRSRLGEILPPYMVPGHFIYLEKLPLSPSGKIDRKALPLPSVQSAPTFLAPASETERLLCAIWENLLGIERVGSADNFFELGGHSLKVTQVLTRIEHQFGIRLPLRDFFDDPTVAALAQRIEARNGQGGDALALTAGLAEADQPAPLSQNQQRLWFLEQLEPGNPAYHIPALYRLEGELDAELLQQTLDLVVERHQALRTTINLKNGLPVQVIHPDMRVPISRRDWPGGDIEETFQEELRRPFDFAKGPLMRVVLWREFPSQHLGMFTLHHIIA